MAWSKSTKRAIGITVAGIGIALVASLVIFHKSIAYQVTLAGGHISLASHKAEVCDTANPYQTPASYFPKIKQFPAWQYVPVGFQVFNNVPLDIEGMTCLWGENNTKRGIVFPEKVEGIEMNRKFESFYVYHCAFFQSPPGTPVYEIVFHYTDDSAFTNEICYGTDVMDWFGKGGPTGPNSKLAWHTDAVKVNGKKPPPLRFCLTEVKNPRPLVAVTSIDLVSCKNGSAGCIHAITTGKSGLMR